MKKLLLVEPDRLQAEAYRRALKGRYQVRWVRSSQAAVGELDTKKFDVVISETNLDHHNGIELLHELRAYEDWIGVPLIFLSGLSRQKFPVSEERFSEFGVKAYLDKATTRPSMLLESLEQVLR